MPGVAARVEAPLQHVPLDHERARYLALGLALGGWPDVDEQSARLDRLVGANRVEPAQSPAGGGQELVDRLARGGRGGRDGGGWGCSGAYHVRSSAVTRSSPLPPTSNRRMLASGG